MAGIVNWVKGFAESIGGPGLFVVAFLDSSFLSLPEVNDLLVIAMVRNDPESMPYYALMATLGSIAGCLVLYLLGRRGGDSLIRRRFGGPRLTRAMELSQRYGILAFAIPAILPPPAPFKVFVLLAGVAKVPISQFVTAVALGRGFRYFAEGWLAVRYGEQAETLLVENGAVVSLVLAGTVAAATIAYFLLRNRNRAPEAT